MDRLEMLKYFYDASFCNTFELQSYFLNKCAM